MTAALPPAPANDQLNANDWALVVGIQDYPGLVGPNGDNKNLKGPDNDAVDFYRWLISPAPEGGGVPADQAKLVRACDYAASEDPLNSHPSFADVELALMRYDSRAKTKNKNGGGLRIGRRLYLYFSGHGCAPAPNESALLTSDFTVDYPGFHIPGRLWAHIFSVRGYFDEVFLIMDCCRENLPTMDVRKPPLDLSMADGIAVDSGRTFFGFATKWSRLAREMEFPGGAIHGVFTYALLEGLSGKAADPGTGQITAATLGSWLSDNMRHYLRAEQLADPDVPKKPDLDYDPVEGQAMVLARVKPPTFPVRVMMSADVVNTRVEVLDGQFNLLASVPQAPPVWEVPLFRGLYLVQAVDRARQVKVQVSGVGGVDVQL